MLKAKAQRQRVSLPPYIYKNTVKGGLRGSGQSTNTVHYSGKFKLL